MIKRLLGALALALTILPASAQTTNPLVNFQSFLNQKIVPNGRGLITGTDLNNVMNRLVPVFNSVCTSFDTNGNCASAPNLVSKLGDTILGSTQLSTAGCTPTTGAKATDGTSSWVPGCTATFLGLDPTSFLNTSVTGMAYVGGAPDPALSTTSQVFINAKTKAGSQAGQNGLFLAFDSGEGAPTSSGLQNNTGLLVVSRQHPRSGGAGAPPTWTVNTNTLCAPGAGGTICNALEQDYTNFDKPCAHVSDGCGIHVMNWHNFQSAFPIAQDTYVSANTAWQNAIVTVSGTAVTPTSGSPFSNDTTTVWLGLTGAEADGNGVALTSTGVAPTHGGTRYRVNPGSYNSSTGAVTLLATPPAGQQGAGIKSAWNSHAVADVFLLSGDTVASDTDFRDNTSAYTGLQFGGFHQVILDSSNDQASVFAALRESTYLCFTGLQNCLTHTFGALSYGSSGGGTFSISDAGNGAISGGFSVGATLTASTIKAAAAGTVGIGNTSNGTSLQITNPAGTVANPLNITGGTSGNSPTISTTPGQFIVFGNGLSITTGGIFAPGIGTTAGAVRGTLCIDNTGIIYVKTSAGACI